MSANEKSLNDRVQDYWQAEPCGTAPSIVDGKLERYSREWFDAIEEYRYRVEPCIHSVAAVTR